MLAALAPVATAQAATVTLEYEPPIPEVEPEPAYTLAVEAARGEANRLEVLRDATGYVVRERGGVVLSAGARCSSTLAREVRCPLSGGASHLSVFVNAGNGDDAVVLGPLPGIDVAEVLGGPGDDGVAGSPGSDLLFGGRGSDHLFGQGGGDRLDGGAGDDSLNGGDGRDLVTYASHSAPVTVDLAAGAGGGAGERDRLVGFEDAAGGSGSDRLFGDGGTNLLYGGIGGRDVGDGRGGDDAVTVRGRARGGPGDDLVDAERVDCGGGDDVTHRQRFKPTGPYGRDCERIRGYFYIVTHPQRVGRRLRFRIACPIRSCRGKVVVRDSRGVLGERPYAVIGEAFGGPKSVPVRVPLSRRPAGRIGRLVLLGQSFARDSFRLRLR